MIQNNRYEANQKAKKLSDAAREARNAASREWRMKNKERVQEYNRRYWERKAAKEAKNNEG